MIHSIKINREALSAYDCGAPNYYNFKEVQLIQDHDEIHFKEGLNVIMGDNGYGKSALLSLITTMAFVSTSRMSDLNHTEFDHIKQNPLFRFVDMIHDGQSCYFLDTNMAVGIKDGYFTNDNFTEAISNIFNNQRQSNGQSTLTDLNAMFSRVLDGDLDKKGFSMTESAKTLADKLHPSHLSSYSESLHKSDKEDIKRNYFDNVTSIGQKTIIVDEFEKGLSVDNAMRVLDGLVALAELRGYQVIIASQSPLLAKLYFDRKEDGSRRANFIGDEVFIGTQMAQMLVLAESISASFEKIKRKVNASID